MIDISFFCSPIGLGHVTRDLAVVEHLKEFSIKFVTGDAAAKFLMKLNFSVEDVYIPPQFVIKMGLLQNSLKWLLRYYKYYNECKDASSIIIEKEKPRIVISDEDFASLTVAQNQDLPTVLITDVLETRFTKGIGTIIERKMNRSMRDIMKKCDVVIVPEEGIDQDNIRRIGPIVRTIDYSREELRKQFSFDKKTIVVSVGGTDAGEFLIKKTIEAYNKIRDDVELVMVSGPSLKKEFQKNIRDLGFINNLHEIIFAADLIITLGGKSTIDESKSYGTPGIFIPIKNHFEQENNAFKEGFIHEDINKLEFLISEKLAEKRKPKSYDGAKKAAEIIKDIFSE